MKKPISWFALVCASIWIVFNFVLWPGMLTVNEKGVQAGHEFVWADWSMHLGIVTNFAYKPVSLWFSSFPIFAGERLNYPFVTNILSGLLLRAGFSLETAMILPVFVSSLVCILPLFWLYKTLLKSTTQAVWASVLMICSGGLGFATAYVYNLDPAKITLTQIHNHDIEFTNIVMAMFVPQRAFLLGFIVGLFALHSVWKVLTHHRVTRAEVLATAVGTGLLPIIHIHTLVSIGVCLGVVTFLRLFALKKYPNARTSLAFFVSISGLIAAAVYMQFSKPSYPSAAFISWHPGWYTTDSLVHWFNFWVKNWGIFFGLSLLGTWHVVRKKSQLAVWAIGWWVVFVVANLFQFQPQIWDNTKIFAWCYIGLAPVAASVWQVAQTKSAKVILVMLFVAASISGASDLFHMLDKTKHTYSMFDPAQIEMAAALRSITPPSATFLTSTYPNNPVMGLAGRSVVLGYPGWAFSYGMPYGDRERDIQVMYDGGPQAVALLNHYNVAYVLIGEHEQILHPNVEFYRHNYPAVFSNAAGTVYQIR